MATKKRTEKPTTPKASRDEDTVPPWLTVKHAPVDDFSSSGDEMVDMFQRYDRDRTGYISRQEFARLLEGLGQDINEDELQIALDSVDPQRTGKISFRKFKAWWLSR